MKINHLLAGSLLAGFAASASAQTTEITITGATAFRQATMQAIYDAYASVGAAGTSFNAAHDFSASNLSQLIASNRAIFSGTFPGITGTTVIRTSFNGSTEGLNAIAGNNNPSFLTAAALSGGNFTDGIKGATTTPTETLRPKFSFSDVYQSTSPVDTDNTGAPITLNPVGESAVGIVTFAMIANDGAPSDLTNVTIQQARALWTNGIQPLSLFTGDPTDTSYVLATGRNDGSGTRSAYLTEWAFGVANLVKQYTATSTGLSANATSGVGNGTITRLTLVPGNGTGTGNFSTGRSNDASTLWGNTAPGNGGYSSSSALRTLMGYTSSNVTVYNGVSQTPSLNNANILLLTWLSTADSRDAAAQGAKILSFNGVLVTPIATSGSYLGSGFSEADYNKIISGAYSAWSYQHLYYHGSLNANEQTWYDAMKNTWISQGLGTTANGLPLDVISVSRADDGLPIFAPL
jgi:hypothetical protein